MKKYKFEGMRFIPSYNDFDFDECVVEALNEEEAYEKLFTLTNKDSWASLFLASVK